MKLWLLDRKDAHGYGACVRQLIRAESEDVARVIASADEGGSVWLYEESCDVKEIHEEGPEEVILSEWYDG